MKDKWRRMSSRDLRSAMDAARRAVAEVHKLQNPTAAQVENVHEAEIDDIAAELSRRAITRYTAIAAVAGTVAAIASLVAALR